jgi:hypothetical protein
MFLAEVKYFVHSTEFKIQLPHNTGNFTYERRMSVRRHVICVSLKDEDSAGGIATGYRLDDQGIGVRVPVGSSPQRPDRLRSSQCVSRALSSGVKRLGCEADHSPPTSAEVKKIWIYTSTPPYAFMA